MTTKLKPYTVAVSSLFQRCMSTRWDHLHHKACFFYLCYLFIFIAFKFTGLTKCSTFCQTRNTMKISVFRGTTPRKLKNSHQVSEELTSTIFRALMRRQTSRRGAGSSSKMLAVLYLSASYHISDGRHFYQYTCENAISCTKHLLSWNIWKRTKAYFKIRHNGGDMYYWVRN